MSNGHPCPSSTCTLKSKLKGMEYNSLGPPACYYLLLFSLYHSVKNCFLTSLFSYFTLSILIPFCNFIFYDIRPYLQFFNLVQNQLLAIDIGLPHFHQLNSNSVRSTNKKDHCKRASTHISIINLILREVIGHIFCQVCMVYMFINALNGHREKKAP